MRGSASLGEWHAERVSCQFVQRGLSKQCRNSLLSVCQGSTAGRGARPVGAKSPPPKAARPNPSRDRLRKPTSFGTAFPAYCEPKTVHVACSSQGRRCSTMTLVSEYECAIHVQEESNRSYWVSVPRATSRRRSELTVRPRRRLSGGKR